MNESDSGGRWIMNGNMVLEKAERDEINGQCRRILALEWRKGLSLRSKKTK